MTRGVIRIGGFTLHAYCPSWRRGLAFAPIANVGAASGGTSGVLQWVLFEVLLFSVSFDGFILHGTCLAGGVRCALNEVNQ